MDRIRVSEALDTGSIPVGGAIRFVAYDGISRADTVTHRHDGQKGYAAGFTGLIDFMDGLMPHNEYIGKAFREVQSLFPSIFIH